MLRAENVKRSAFLLVQWMWMMQVRLALAMFNGPDVYVKMVAVSIKKYRKYNLYQ